jgi:hypothetical protein
MFCLNLFCLLWNFRTTWLTLMKWGWCPYLVTLVFCGFFKRSYLWENFCSNIWWWRVILWYLWEPKLFYGWKGCQIPSYLPHVDKVVCNISLFFFLIRENWHGGWITILIKNLFYLQLYYRIKLIQLIWLSHRL